MSVNPGVAADIEILQADGATWMSLALVETNDRDGNVLPKALETQLASLVAELPVRQKLQSKVWQNRGLGIGLDYNTAYGLYTRTPGIVIPAGAATPVTVTGAKPSNSPIRAIEEFGADLFFAQLGTGVVNTGRVFVIAGGTGAIANSKNLAVNRYMYDLCLFSNPVTGTRYLYACSNDVNGLNGELHRYTAGAWTADSGAVFGTNGFRRLFRVYWRGRDGISYPRMVAISGDNKISYTLPGADPYLAASWVFGVEIDTAKVLLDLGGAKRHVWMRAQDNVFDLNEVGESPALMSHETEVSADGFLFYLRDYLYVGTGRTLNRVYVGDAQAVIQEAASNCMPGFGTVAENDLRGYPTAACSDQGLLVMAIHNASATRSFICWGSDQGVPQGHPNPLLWYGPEAFFDADYKVTRMKTSGLAGDLRLWVAAQTVAGSAASLHWVSLPQAGAPLQDIISAGGMRFNNGDTGAGFLNTFNALDLLPEPMPWDGTTTILDRHAFVTRSLTSGGATMDIATQADPSVGVLGKAGATWPAVDGTVSASPIATIIPASVTTVPSTAPAGARLWRRIKIHSPAAASTPPIIGVLDACRMDTWQIVPSVTSLPTLTVQYGEGIRNIANSQGTRDPDYVTDELRKLCGGGATPSDGRRTRLKTRDGKVWSVKFDQLLETQTEYTATGPYTGKVITAKLTGYLLAGPL